MKKLFLLLLFISSLTAFSQPYNNAWIDYNKTYYKFKVGANGLYRISQANLNAIGLGNAVAEQFQLWRNGEQVIIYTSAATGPLGASGYIEFWGLMNDGTKDTRLYRNPDYQLSDHWSLETDTASYFLTLNAASANLRYINSPNNVSGNTLAPEPFFMNKTGMYYKNTINPGYAVPVGGPYIYSSSYDIGEGYTSNEIYPAANLSLRIDSLNLYTTGPNASFKIGLAGNAPNARTVKIRLFNTLIIDQAMSSFGYLKKEVNDIPLSAFTNPDFLQVNVQNGSAVPTDRMVVSFIEITYPRNFNCSSKKNFEFELPATAQGNYLVIDNFNFGGIAPVLFDVTSGKRYAGDISTPGKVKIVLPPSTAAGRKCILVNEEAGNINSVNDLAQVNFINYANTANQANYIIISNSALFDNGAGINFVEEYRAYRSSAAGGGFSAKIYDIDQLTDQFAFGIRKHPLAIKDFIQFAKNTFTDTARFVFLMGKGVNYSEYGAHQSNPLSQKLNLVPSYGNPASDILLSSNYGSTVPSIPIGRLSAINGNEIAIYLTKMKEFEAAQNSASETVADKAWMKNTAHVIGGKDNSESYLFNFYMEGYKNIIADTLYGANVETFSKSSAAAVQVIAGKRIEELFNEGIGFLGYFGHSSANTLEFNLNSPETYHNQGKYPFFNVSGCTAGDNYIYDESRLTGGASLSEKYILANQRGSIGFLASSHLGIPPILDPYNKELYRNISITNYGKPVGNAIMNTVKNLGGALPGLDYFTRINLEEVNLHGDPALKVFTQAKPDYIVEDPMVKISPSIVTVADNSFNVAIKMLNIGKALNDSIRVFVTRKLPNDSIVILYNKEVKAIKYGDSLELNVPINPVADKGSNSITVTVDADNEVEELSELNNTVVKNFYIFEDEVRPVYPYNFSIINKQNINFYCSSADPFSTSKQVMMEIDTTELFNSSLKQSMNKTAAGGILQFNPSLTYLEGRVYYWRVGTTPQTGPVIWNTSSFVYLTAGASGFNQSHYYQFLKSTYKTIELKEDRNYSFEPIRHQLRVAGTTYPTGGTAGSEFSIFIDGSNNLYTATCGYGIVFNVFDTVTLKPLFNNRVGQPGRFGSYPVCFADRPNNFQFDFNTVAGRKKAIDFMDSIPAGSYVVVRMIEYPDVPQNVYAAAWMNDQSIYGAGISLYHKLFNAGMYNIDSFNRPRTFNFIYKKNDLNFTPISTLSLGIYDRISNDLTIDVSGSSGTILSPLFGPAKTWKELHWKGRNLEQNVPDDVAIEVYGVNYAGSATRLATVINADTSLAFISALTYPYLQLKMLNNDTLNGTAHQLDYWRINADYVPEGAVAPNISLQIKDTLEAGENLDFVLAFKNISENAFDSLKINFTVTDKNNVPHIITLPKGKPLNASDTLLINYKLDTRSYAGINTLFVEVNPGNDQPEQYHFNNFVFKNFFVKGDNAHPLLDVTFDGIHILNRDIVSAAPHIIVKLKDENKFLALNDTSLLKVQIEFPDGTLHEYKFDNDTLRFTPANLTTGENTATIDFTPQLAGNDDEYQLIVSGKDASGNAAGELEYRVSFRIYSKPMISDMLNYPNPFTTSTAFVFTVTGKQPPPNIRIQILTITGKIVREITKEELGPLHIGRNITDFKWDGTDMYGQKLANGVYLYRMITRLDGKSMDAYEEVNDLISQGDGRAKKGKYDFIVKGYGKMYLMR